MPKKETRQTQKTKANPQGISWKTIGILLGGVTAFMAGVVTWLDFISYLQSDSKVILWAGIAFFVVVWGIIVWLLYNQANPYRYLWFAVTLLATVIAGIGWTSIKRTEEAKIKAIDEKIVILFATFDGPENVYDLRGEMIQKTRDATEDYGDTEIIDSPTLVTKSNGKDAARALGRENHADIVIWASYQDKTDPNITIYLEYLFAEDEFPKQIDPSRRYTPEATRDQLQQTIIQKELGTDTSALIAYIVGQARFTAGDYETARVRFEHALEQNQKSIFFSPEEVLVDIGNCYLYTFQYNKAAEYYTQAIDTNPTDF